MTRILYLMHIDWRWITQRPHHLAHELQRRGYDVDVRFIPAWRRSNLVKPSEQLASSKLSVSPMPHLPPINPLVRYRLNPRLRRSYNACAREPDIVWITHPLLLASVPMKWRSKVVYDAMDLVEEFDNEVGPLVHAAETATCEVAQAIICSSTAIAERLHSLHFVGSKTHLVRNACQDRSDWPLWQGGNGGPLRQRGRLAYFGTISSWFDFESLIDALEMHPHLSAQLIGPADVDIPRHKRIFHTPPMPAEELFRECAKAEALIMPFKRTALIEGVDPVKLYEYVALGRPVVSVGYPGIQHFSEVVRFYDEKVSLGEVLSQVASQSNRVDSSIAAAFVRSNTWSARGEAVDKILMKVARAGSTA